MADRARRSADPLRDSHRGRGQGLQRRRRHQERPDDDTELVRRVVDAEGSVAQPRAGSLETDHRRGERLLHGRRHDHAVCDRHARRLGARDVQFVRGQAGHHRGQWRHATHAAAVALVHRHGDATDRRSDRRQNRRTLGPDQQGRATQRTDEIGARICSARRRQRAARGAGREGTRDPLARHRH